MQRILIILKWRHRLLHMRASVKRNSGQSTFHCIRACQQSQGLNKFDKTFNCLFIFKNHSDSWKMDWYWTRNSISIQRSQWQRDWPFFFFRHGQLPQEENESIEFWRLKNDLRNKFEHSQYWSDDTWKSKMTKEEETRKDFNIVLARQNKKFFTSELFKVISRRNPIDPSSQDNVSLPDNFFEYICHIGCAINLHSIPNSGLTVGENSSKEKHTMFFATVNPMNKDHKDPQEIDLTKPRLASCKQKWKRHQVSVYWADIQLTQRKGLKFYQTRCNAIILYDTLPTYWISKILVMETGEVKKSENMYVWASAKDLLQK